MLPYSSSTDMLIFTESFVFRQPTVTNRSMNSKVMRYKTPETLKRSPIQETEPYTEASFPSVDPAIRTPPSPKEPAPSGDTYHPTTASQGESRSPCQGGREAKEGETGSQSFLRPVSPVYKFALVTPKVTLHGLILLAVCHNSN